MVGHFDPLAATRDYTNPGKRVSSRKSQKGEKELFSLETSARWALSVGKGGWEVAVV
jgi:hypothetical protein